MSLNPPPLQQSFFNAKNQITEVWKIWLTLLTSDTNGAAPANAPFVTVTDDARLTNPTNLGLLASGYLKIVVALGLATPSTTTTIPATDLTGTLQAAQFPALTGDVTTPGASLVTTLANSGVAAGSYGDSSHVPQVTFDAKGRATSATNVAIDYSLDLEPAGDVTVPANHGLVYPDRLVMAGTLTVGAGGVVMIL